MKIKKNSWFFYICRFGDGGQFIRDLRESEMQTDTCTLLKKFVGGLLKLILIIFATTLLIVTLVAGNWMFFSESYRLIFIDGYTIPEKFRGVYIGFGSLWLLAVIVVIASAIERVYKRFKRRDSTPSVFEELIRAKRDRICMKVEIEE